MESDEKLINMIDLEKHHKAEERIARREGRFEAAERHSRAHSEITSMIGAVHPS